MPQDGQALGGLTTDSPRGTRQMTTLRKEPMASPSTEASDTTKTVTAQNLPSRPESPRERSGYGAYWGETSPVYRPPQTALVHCGKYGGAENFSRLSYR